MPVMQFDWAGLINLLAQSLYSEKRIFLRELVQNAHDAILRRHCDDRSEAGRIDISTAPLRGELVIRDNGIGMNDSDLHEYLSTIGTGATRAQEGVPGLIGRFGIGFLSAFIVAERVTVETRKLGESRGWRWVNTGSREYKIDPCDVPAIGTSVIVQVRRCDTGVISPEEISDVVKTYADWMQVPVFLNGSRTPLNRMTMPWENDSLNGAALAACELYAAEISGDLPLELIPFRDNNTSALLYITKSRAIGVAAPRAVRLFVKRMLISKNLPEVLPPWASFVNGVINSDVLMPTAARDNVVRSTTFDATCEQLGGVIISYLESLKTKNPSRFREIQRYHALSIKAACCHFEEFFNRFVELLEWRTNALPNESDNVPSATSRARTLPEILRIVRSGTERTRKPLRCFGSGNTSSLFFQMATASKTLVVDASDPFEMAILRAFIEKYPGNQDVELLRVDRQEDPLLFRMLGSNEDHDSDVLALARRMQETRIVQPDGRKDSDSQTIVRLTVSARRFAPASLPALLRPGERSAEVESAQEALDDPNTPPMFKKIAQSVLDSAAASASVILNANNSLIQNAANALMLQRSQQSAGMDIDRLLLGIYNSAFISSDMINERNASIVHDNLIHFMGAYLESNLKAQTLEKRNDLLSAEIKSGDRVQAPQDSSGVPKCVFMMTPFSPEYDALIAALRILIEDRWWCELVLASDKKYEDRILDSVREHIVRADLFIAELTEANPNVMFELGSVFANRRARPIVSLVKARQGEGSHRSVQLPADLGSLIYVDYGMIAPEPPDRIADFLEHELRKDVEVERIVSDISRPKFVSYRRVSVPLNNLITERECKSLCRRFPTEAAWRTAEPSTLMELLDTGAEEQLAELVLSRVHKALGIKAVTTEGGGGARV